MSDVKRYLEDYEVGESMSTSGRTISDADFLLWGGIEHDFPAIHFDAPAMESSRSGARIGAGFISMALSVGMFAQHDLNWYWPTGAVKTTRWDRLRFLRPLRISDTIYCERTIAEILIEDDDTGVLVHQVIIRNQRGEDLAEGSESIRVRRDPNGIGRGEDA